MELYAFQKDSGTGFSYVFERNLKPGDKLIVKMPLVTANKRGINDIGWLTNGDVKLEATLSKNPKSDEALWQAIRKYDEINKVTSALRITNNGDNCRIEIRVILN